MPYSMYRVLVFASLLPVAAQVREQLQQLVDAHRLRLEPMVLKFVLGEITPEAMYDFEQQLAAEFRETARQLLEGLLNLLEADEPGQMPHDVHYRGCGFRRLNQKTRNANVATLFGTIVLWRYGYRDWQRGSGEPVIFPLEIQLGLLCGATPALAEAAGRYMAEAGATQQVVLARLREQHAVHWGVPRLRELTGQLAESLQGQTPELEAARVLELLEEATSSQGSRRPVLCVGRDGVTLREYRYRFFENASVGTVTVYNRSGKRLGTVYLAFAPQLGQGNMTQRLTWLVREVLRRWEGPLPRLAYVTDAGDTETSYYRRVLCNMRHPRTGERLSWQRIVDFYHAAERVWTMAEALFGSQSAAGRAWARRMCRVLKQPGGPHRVLHSAAALRAARRLSKTRAADFRKAYNYIRRRTRVMQYYEYRKLHLPIGSGVTEAACKTIFAQRLKLSGMRWGKEGAQVILDLRVVLLSGIWERAYREHLRLRGAEELRTYDQSPEERLRLAA